jgi:hypothetical protein
MGFSLGMVFSDCCLNDKHEHIKHRFKRHREMEGFYVCKAIIDETAALHVRNPGSPRMS